MDNNQNNTFTPLENDYPHKSSILQDEHELIKIENKTAQIKNIGKIVRGETHSNILTFEMDRYYDGADLSTKGIQFIVKNDDGVIIEPATNLEYNEELIRFSWVMSHFATRRKIVIVAIEIYGVLDDEDYSLKTVPFTLEIEDSLDSSNMNTYIISDSNLYVNLVNRLSRIEDKLEEVNGTSSHTHNNKSTLDKLGQSSNGNLLFNGKEIVQDGGKDGTDGEDGITPHIDPTTKHWFIGTFDTGIVAEGMDGKSAYELAVENGFDGNEIEWLDSLKGTVELGNVDNTSDIDKPVSTAQRNAIDEALYQSNCYTDTKISELINDAPETLDTIKEVADAIAENETIIEALDAAIGTKANQNELYTHIENDTIHVTQSDKTNLNIAKEHANSQHARVDATKVEKSDVSGNIKINGVETSVLSLTTSFDETEEGVAALDSTVGKILKDDIDELSNKLGDGAISFEVVDGIPYVKVGADAPRPFNSTSSIGFDPENVEIIEEFQFDHDANINMGNVMVEVEKGQVCMLIISSFRGNYTEPSARPDVRNVDILFQIGLRHNGAKIVNGDAMTLFTWVFIVKPNLYDFFTIFPYLESHERMQGVCIKL